MNLEYLNGKSILVTGGTGSLGQRLVRTLIEKSQARRIIVFSRDELKQSQMQTAFKGMDSNLRFFLGDVRDLPRLQLAFRDVDFVIHTAALKQVPALEYNPFEAIQTNIIGTQNVITAAINNGVEKVLLISTDKAANPANLYGATKLCAERLCISANVYSNNKTLFSAVRYGNVLGSRGSLLKLVEDQRKTGVVLLTHEDMTRFWITLDQGVELVMNSMECMNGGEIFIPKIPSMRVKDLLTSLAPECELKIIGIRPGEKLHEVLITPEESHHAVELESTYVIYPEFSFDQQAKERVGGRMLESGFSFCSDTNPNWLDDAGLKELLALIRS
ncbi:MAG: UDP-N-acetylglucosamine 4,6-dehydratase (inverting) [Patescibacteria group bacterium]